MATALSHLRDLMPYVNANHYHHLVTIFMAESRVLVSFTTNLRSTSKWLNQSHKLNKSSNWCQ